MKSILLAGLSALALTACATATAPSSVPAAAHQATLAGPAAFRILSAGDVTASLPKMGASGNVKAYVGDFLTWIMEPGHLVERSSLFMSGEPPEMPEGVDFESIIGALAEEGHPAAQLIQMSDTPDGLVALANDGNATAKLAIEMNNISVGSLQQKVDALAWFRSEAPANRDAAFALGSVLLSQAGGGDWMNIGFGAATPGEVREGAALLLKAAEAAPVDIMLQIGTMMGSHAGVDPLVDGHARKILELVVAETDAAALPEMTWSDDFSEAEMDAYMAYEAKLTELSSAVEARIVLAGMLAKGQGGAADLERAKGLYREALTATQDFRAYEALAGLGVDVSEYDALFAQPEGGDDWWDLEPDAPEGAWGEPPELAPPPPSN